ncbi:MAG: Pycsar system effector family protein [Bacteroidota bacterium]
MGNNKNKQKEKAIEKDRNLSEQKIKQFGKGRDIMYRAVYGNQAAQNQIADNKASILISINTAIISALVAITVYSSDAGVLEDSAILIIPVFSILFTCLISIVFALLSARPKVVNILKSQTRKSSLLFFGVISSFSQEEYIQELDAMLLRGDEVYRHMSIDVYNQGVVLRKKFNLLSYSYQVFLVGFVISVFLFLIVITTV